MSHYVYHYMHYYLAIVYHMEYGTMCLLGAKTLSLCAIVLCECHYVCQYYLYATDLYNAITYSNHHLCC